jgi:PKD repeat protein
MYSVDWGEEQNMMARMFSREDMVQSSATFTHSYQNEGTYTPKFTVTDEDGHTASVSATVVVVDAE